MLRYSTILILASLLLFTFSLHAQEIAITFDDAPTPDGPLYTGNQRTTLLIDHLKKENVQTTFFAITSQINTETKSRLSAYTQAGHSLANHTHTHSWIHRIGTQQYIADFQQAHSMLNDFPGYKNWFRYPFLDEGRTIAVRDSIRSALTDLGLQNGYVTIDNYDWYINHLLKNAVENKKEIDFPALKAFYIDHIWTSIQFYDSIAKAVIGRSPKHVLLLHENDLAARFLPDLIQHLKQNGWKIISPEEAYQDPISQHIPNVLFNGQGRIGAIAREKGLSGRDLVQKSEDEQYLDSLSTEKKIFR